MEKLSRALLNKRSEKADCDTQNEVAKKIGISTPTYCYLERGAYRHRLKPNVIGKLANYLGKTPGEIIEMFKEDLI